MSNHLVFLTIETRIFRRQTPTPLFAYGKGRGTVYHARIRMGLSALYKINKDTNTTSYLMHHVIHVTIAMKIPSTTFLSVPYTN